tara:strand:- start:1145 stop:1831 length:687 start_codon:yes stop_codon:yes gene_type:complete
MTNNNVLIISKDSLWTRELFDSLSLEPSKEFKYFLLSEFTEETIASINPKWIFFFHWSEKVPKSIYNNYRCAVIHTSNLPEGRGGSPIQNQILDGIMNTRVNIIEMVDKFDAGGIYCSRGVTLQGTLTDIWLAISSVAKNLILECTSKDLRPKEQIGSPKNYKRRRDNEINFGKCKNLLQVYDVVRMLDTAHKEYPKSFCEIGDFILEFSRAKLEEGSILSDVRISKK